MGVWQAFIIILPIFAVIALGYGARAGKIIGRLGTHSLTVFVFQFAIPPFIFRAIARTELPETLPFALWGSYFGAIVFIWLISFALLAFSGRTRREKITLAFGGGFSNSILIGLPVIVLALGEAAALPLFLIYAVHGLVLFTLAIVLMESVEGFSGAGFMEGLRESLRALISNPIVLAVFGGLLLNISGIGLWPPIDQFCQILGQSGIAAALFVTGASLAGYRLQRAVIQPALLVSVLKLVIHPLLVFLLGYYVFSLSPLYLSTAVLLAATPSGVFTFLLAQRYRAAPDAASGAIVLSTLFALVSLPLVVALTTNL